MQCVRVAPIGLRSLSFVFQEKARRKKFTLIVVGVVVALVLVLIIYLSLR